MDEPPEPPLSLRRSNVAVGLALLAWLTALFLTWWSATNRSPGYEAFTVGFGLWSHPASDVDVHGGFIWLTDVLALLPVPILFVRVAARSIEHEPRSWRRDVGGAACGMVAALASAAPWPVELPFLGSTHFAAGNGTLEQTITSGPGAGWWLGAVATVVVGWAWWRTRRA
ncbi:MAG: hypothetical protein ABR562_02500 [Thermoplasmatota archaeon]